MRPGILPFLCISVEQPFAELIIAGVQNTLTRTFRAAYRGLLFIHAGVYNSKWEKELQGQVAAGYLAKKHLNGLAVRCFGRWKPVERAIVGMCACMDCDRVADNPFCLGDGWYHRYRFPVRLSKPIEEAGRMRLYHPKFAIKHLPGIDQVKIQRMRELCKDLGFKDAIEETLAAERQSGGK